jgi:hypothetical protein
MKKVRPLFFFSVFDLPMVNDQSGIRGAFGGVAHAGMKGVKARKSQHFRSRDSSPATLLPAAQEGNSASAHECDAGKARHFLFMGSLIACTFSAKAGPPADEFRPNGRFHAIFSSASKLGKVF